MSGKIKTRPPRPSSLPRILRCDGGAGGADPTADKPAVISRDRLAEARARQQAELFWAGRSHAMRKSARIAA